MGGDEDSERRDFFISYTAADAAWAEWIAWTLEEAGYTTFLQTWDFTPGAHFVQEMHRATSLADRTIAVLSGNYLQSQFASAEWQEAWRADPSGEQRRLLVLRVEDCDRPGLLGQVVSVDLFGMEMETARSHLLSAVSSERRKPPLPPDFPGAEAPITPPPFPGRLIPASAEESYGAGGPISRENPFAVAYMWWYGILQLNEEIVRSTVTPESDGQWDLPALRSRTSDSGIATGVMKPVYDVAYVRLAEDLPEGAAVWQLVGGQFPTEVMVVTLVLRPELGGWRVHAVGQPVPPSALPRTWTPGLSSS
ncbi:toll/interleukin-1 receptor domain-containing protein [Mycobacterium deserti]|uniref:Toll/interleukin-1 receptor domain-containing protein n=1 Tax=Mycobacterium deserti TaxID=2978347 RepID=A0ABT2M5V5_9MYCO|nr:toll/interleukin-1 receptor domain-containing protein [Mycobacterium deserti]MCT7657642.1 toll/interleukin-1 receptor domain-containing protein [Mycobacterium deserti]